MRDHPVVSREEWLAARRKLLAREKELTHLRDQIARERRALPWVRVEERYVFDGPSGKEELSDLFDGRSQLLVYHFMFDPQWNEGCKSCSFWADNYNSAVVHLAHRDVTFVTISKAPFEKLQAFKDRMGWTFKWVSSFSNTFNRDYGVSFTPEEKMQESVHYNFATVPYFSSQGPGISAFYRDGARAIFHTYSCYARGLDIVNGAYQYLDLVPKGRDEDGLPYTMAWLRHHDRYDQ